MSDHYPTNAWRPGEVIPDYHEIPIGVALPPGDYRLEVGLFPPFAETGLPVDSGQTDRVALGAATITPGWAGKPPQPTIARRDRIAPNLILIGTDAAGQVRPGGQARLRLYWQVSGPLPNYQPTLVLRGEGSSGPSSTSAWQSEYVTSAWPTGEIIVTQHTIHAPTGLNGSQGIVQLELDAQSPRLTVARLRVEGVPVTGQEAALNFGDQMMLLDYDLSQVELRPGDVLEMTVNWQSLADMSEDYTIFVHLLGPDGLSHGQVDVWPHDGAYPTSNWPIGKVIADTYRVPLDTDAPAGAYRIEVGVYLLRTMSRLPVLNAANRPVDDKLLIAGLTVKK